MVFKVHLQQSYLDIFQVIGEIAEKGKITMFFLSYREKIFRRKLLCPLDVKKLGSE